MAQAKEVKLAKRQIHGEEAEAWRSPLCTAERRPGQHHWVAITTDAQGKGPVYRVTATKGSRELVTPEAVAERVRGELVMCEGRVRVIEVAEGLPIYQASFALGYTAEAAQRICLATTDPDRQPLTPLPSEEGIKAGISEARARRELARLREEDAPEAAVEEKLREVNEACAALKAAQEVAEAEVAGERVHPAVR